MALWGKTGLMVKAEPLVSIKMGRYPQIAVEKGSSRQVIIAFNKTEKAVLVFQNNKIRDVLCLIIQKIREKLGDFYEEEEELASPMISEKEVKT